jgi:uncharacterized oligopeptide transporter (OPT) family protein
MIGILLGLILELLRLPILPFALGLYLPLSLSTAVMIGGLTMFIIKHYQKNPAASQRGTLAASGLIAGDAVTGVAIALFTILGIIPISSEALLPDLVSPALYCALGTGLAWLALKPHRYFLK